MIEAILIGIQLALLIGLFMFLIKVRQTIQPTGNWWSFVIRDVLWIALVVNHLLGLVATSVFNENLILVAQFVITCLLAYSIVSRYRLQRDVELLRQDLRKRIDQLEQLREREGW